MMLLGGFHTLSISRAHRRETFENSPARLYVFAVGKTHAIWLASVSPIADSSSARVPQMVT